MISASDAYRAAVCADTRRTVVKVETDVTDPDILYLGVTGSEQAEISVQEQAFGNHDSISRYATLERNYWLLDGTMDLFDDNYERNTITDKVGCVSDAISRDDGAFQTAQELRFEFNYNGLLQIASLYFSDEPNDGVPDTFDVAVLAGGVEVYKWSSSGNKSQETQGKGFEAYDPDTIVLTVTKWSVPGRRIRLRQVLPGFRLIWSGDDIASLTVEHNTDPSCVTLPYGVAKLSVDNSGRAFEPRNKEGFFRSIQARQMVEIFIGLYVDGDIQYKRIGRYYQHSGGWSTSDNGLSIDWHLVDIIGLIEDRDFVIPADFPVTLSDYAAAVVAHLGRNFSDRYHVDPAYANISVTVPKRRALYDKKLGDIVRFLGLATGTWPRADAKTGALTFEPLWDQGARISLDNMNNYPIMSENEEVGTIIITKPEIIDPYTNEIIEEEKNVFGGTKLSASKSISIESPFISDDTDINRMYKQIISQCGGNAYDVTWRGDPTSECGDVVTLELDERNATSARLIEQSFDYSSGVLSNCKARLIQPSGYWAFANGVTLTEDCIFTVPESVSVIYIIVVGGGHAGRGGSPGDFEQDGEDGEDGYGGRVYSRGLNVYPGQTFGVTIGQGADIWTNSPTPSMFGPYSSNDGDFYNPSFTDIRAGAAYARKGVKNPLPNTGDGGKGGKGGKKGKMHTEKEKDDYGFVSEITIVDVSPTRGQPGSPGASGCVSIYWN